MSPSSKLHFIPNDATSTSISGPLFKEPGNPTWKLLRKDKDGETWKGSYSASICGLKSVCEHRPWREGADTFKEDAGSD